MYVCVSVSFLCTGTYSILYVCLCVCVCVQQPDCYRGVVVDGLHSHFIQHPILAAALVLKALGDRKHLYFVNLTFTYEAHLARLEAVEREEERRRGLCASASRTALT